MIAKRYSLFVACLALLLVWTSGSSQSKDRKKIERRIDELRAEIRPKEAMFLSASPEDLAAFSDFLLQPDTGMARLLPREKYDGLLLTRGGGSYYSFIRLTNEYGFGTQIGLEQGLLRTGFAGADFGFLTSLGNIPLDGITLDQPGISYLAHFVTPTAEPQAREQQRISGTGFEVDGFTYRSHLEAVPGVTYVLRSISYGDSDVLVAFRITREDTDGSVIVLWKILKTFPVPQLVQ